MRTKLIIGGILLLLIIIFIVQNTEVVSIKFLFWELSLSRVLMVFLVFLTGGILGWVGHGFYKSHKK